MTVSHVGLEAGAEAVIVDWLGHLYDEVPTGWLTLFSIDPVTGERAVDWAPVDDYDAFASAAGRRAPTHNVWWGVATRRERLPAGQGRGGDADCAHVPALWLDVDVAGPNHKGGKPLPPTADDARLLIAEWPLAPSAVVHTGGGLQAWWALAEPAGAQALRPLLDRWRHTWQQLGERHGWHVDNVFDLARVMRLPGTFNRKGEPQPVQAIESDWSLRYGLDDVDQHLQASPERPAPAVRPAWEGPARPGDAFNQAHTTSEVLAANGWQLHHRDRNGDEHWTRPGKELRQGTSAQVYMSEDGHVTVWSDSVPGVEVKRPYDAFGLLTVLRFGGDYTAASDHLEAQGYGTKGRPDDLSWVAAASSNGNGHHPPEGADEAPQPTLLPDELWEARPALAHIRAAAHSRQRSADALLHVVLARLAAITPHTCHLPAIVGAPAPLSYFTAIVAPPGVGKSSADAIGAELLPAPEWVLDHLPLGSGEGLAESLFELVDETGEDGKVRKAKRQVKHNAYVFADEGQSMAEIGGRSGSTLLPAVRTIWTGGTLGQANASAERRRIVPAGSYAFGLCLAMQPTKAGALLDDADGGTPQRFGWASAVDPTIPDEPPGWPGQLPWEPPPRIAGGSPVGVHPDVAAEVRAADLARARGESVVDQLDAHSGLFRLKVAGLLAILDGRTAIGLDDWALAAVVQEASDSVRASVVATVATDAAQREVANRDRHAQREVAADEAVGRRRTVDCARKVAERVRREPGVTWSVVRRSLTARLREVAEDGLEHAKAEGWVAEVAGAGQGTKSRVLAPGKGSR